MSPLSIESNQPVNSHDKFSNVTYHKLKTSPDTGRVATDITYIEAIKEVVQFCSPSIFTALASTATNIWSSHLYGKLGGNVLAAEAVTIMWQSLIMRIATTGGLRTTLIFTGQLNGRSDENSNLAIGNVNKTALVLSICYSALLIPIVANTGNIIEGIGIINDPAILSQIQNYFDGYIYGIPASLFLSSDLYFSLALRNTQMPLTYNFLQTGLSILLSYPFALGKWGSPELGAKGIGYAMSISAWTSWLFLRLHFLYEESQYKKFNLLNFNTVKMKSLKKYIQYATPLAAANLIRFTQRFFYAQFVTSAGKNVAQAYSSISPSKHIVPAVWSYSSSINALISNNDPSKFLSNKVSHEVAHRKCERLSKTAVFTTLGVTALLSSPMLIWPETIIKFGGGHDLSNDVMKLAEFYLLLSFFDSLSNGYLAPLVTSLYGLKDIKGTFFIDLLEDASTITMAALTLYYLENPNLTVASSLAGEFVGIVAYTLRWWIILRHLKSMTPNIDDLENQSLLREDESIINHFI